MSASQLLSQHEACSPHYLCLQHCPVPCSQQGLQHCLVIRGHHCLQHYSALHSQLCSQYYSLLINICPFWFNHAFHTQQCIPAITSACLSYPNQRHTLCRLSTFSPQSTLKPSTNSSLPLLPQPETCSLHAPHIRSTVNSALKHSPLLINSCPYWFATLSTLFVDSYNSGGSTVTWNYLLSHSFGGLF